MTDAGKSHFVVVVHDCHAVSRGGGIDPLMARVDTQWVGSARELAAMVSVTAAAP